MLSTALGVPGAGAKLTRELAAVGEALRRSTVRVHTPGYPGAGSGVIWNADGVIVTNAHVARGAVATVELWDGRSLPAAVTAHDRVRDLASLRVEATDLPAASAAEAHPLRVGELVLALGNPLGWSGALSLGVVHAVGGTRRGDRSRWIRADVRLAPGNSGGLLADARGRVVGINTMIARGLALAVPAAAVTRFLRGTGATLRLGITARVVGARTVPARRLGLLVLTVERGGLAAEAGVLPGDVLIGIGEQAFEMPDDLAAALLEVEPGEVLRLELIRGGEHNYRELHVPAAEEARAA